MDEYDIIDLVFQHVKNANTGFALRKDRSEEGIEENHIVVNHLKFSEEDYENHLPVNVNIFVKNFSSGTPNRNLLKQTKSAVKKELLKIDIDNGKYRHVEIEGSFRIANAKKGFDCQNILVLIKTDKKW